MEFKINRQSFLEGISKAIAVVERKNTMPVLSNILLQVDKNGLKIVATDLEVAIVCQIPVQCLSAGEITVPSRSFGDIIREIQHPEITFTVQENQRISIRAGASSFVIPGLDASQFPPLPQVEANSIELSCETFLKMIEKTSFAMSTNETRLNLSGVFLTTIGSSTLRMVATDGHRLALVDQEADLNKLGPVKVIIPRKGVTELKKLVSKEGTFELGIGTKNLFARRGNETLYVRLIDGDFPDYARVIPEKNERIAAIPKEPFVGALRRVSLLSDEKSRGVVLNISPGHLKVFIKNQELGEASEEMEINYKSEKMNVGFNAKYFLDLLSVLSGDEVLLALHSDLSPCLVKSEKDSGFLSVIMPMRI